MTRRGMGRDIAVVAAVVAAFAAVGLAACGVTPRSSANGEAAPTETPGAETTVAPTWSTITRLPTPAGSPTPTPRPAGGRVVPGQVTVTLDKPAYRTTDPIMVHVSNGLSASIFVADHQSGCTIVTLERLVGGAWQPTGQCRLMTPTRLVEIPMGTTVSARFGGAGRQVVTPPWPAGTYRAVLAYASSALGAAAPVYSATFEIQ